MCKKYIVRLSDEERQILTEIIKTAKGGAEKIRRAHILLKADANGPNWIDKKIAEAFDCSIHSIELLREKLVTQGFEAAINRKQREDSPRKKLLSGEQEAELIALRLSAAPEGYGQWSLRLIGNKMIELGMVDTISHETVRRTLKKWH